MCYCGAQGWKKQRAHGSKGPRICADLEKESKMRKKGELMIQFCVKILNSLIAFQSKSLENWIVFLGLSPDEENHRFVLLK